MFCTASNLSVWHWLLLGLGLDPSTTILCSGLGWLIRLLRWWHTLHPRNVSEIYQQRTRVPVKVIKNLQLLLVFLSFVGKFHLQSVSLPLVDCVVSLIHFVFKTIKSAPCPLLAYRSVYNTQYQMTSKPKITRKLKQIEINFLTFLERTGDEVY